MAWKISSQNGLENKQPEWLRKIQSKNGTLNAQNMVTIVTIWGTCVAANDEHGIAVWYNRHVDCNENIGSPEVANWCTCMCMCVLF